MSWFNASGFASLAKTALDQAQKTIDKALDIKDVYSKPVSSSEKGKSGDDVAKSSSSTSSLNLSDDRDNFFKEFGISEPTEPDIPPQTSQVSTSVWGSFSGSFFDTGASDKKMTPSAHEEKAIATQPKKAFDMRDAAPRRQRSVSAEDRAVSTLKTAAKVSEDDEKKLGRLRPRFDTCPGEMDRRRDEGDRSVKPGPRTPVTSEPKSSDSAIDFSDSFSDPEAKTSSTEMFGSVGSVISEKDCQSSSTLTPDVFSDSGESFVPVVMSGSWADEKDEDMEQEEDGGEGGSGINPETIDVKKGTGQVASTRSMLEEAMVESSGTLGTPGTRSPESTVSSSEPTKMGSEENSGHTSGDEAETATSSDIEIISPNGEPWGTGDRINSPSCASLSPVKRPQGVRAPRNQGPTADSPPGAGPTSPKGWHHRNASEMSVSSEESDGSQATMDVVLKKLAEVSRVLEAREAKVLELSKENARLRDGVNALETLMKRREEAHSAEALDVTNLTKDFTERMSRKEKETQAGIKEKESLQNELRIAKEEIASRVSAAQVDDMTKEKDAQIAELMQEGEKLSKQLLQHSNIIKKLRTKEKDTDTLLAQQKGRLQELSDEASHTAKALSAKEEVEKRQIEGISQLTSLVQKLESDLVSANIRCTNAEEKGVQAQNSLEESRRELMKWKTATAEATSKAQEVSLSAEMTAKEEVRAIVEQVKRDARMEQEGLVLQLEQLRKSATAAEEAAASRQDSLRVHIADLQIRLQEVEERNEDLTNNVAAATRPLLRQMDNLQSTLNSQTVQTDRTEKNLKEKLQETSRQLAAAIDRERTVTSKYADVSAKVSALESQNQLLQQDQLRAAILLEAESKKISQMEESNLRGNAMVQDLNRSFAEETERLRREKGTLEHHLEIEKVALDAERRRRVFVQEQLADKEQRLLRYEGREGRRDSDSSRRTVSSEEDQAQSQTVEPSRAAHYEGLRTAGGVSTVLENLQAQLKQREGEIAILQAEVAQQGRVRESMTREVVIVNSTNEALALEMDEQRLLLDHYRRMECEYNALLQMYGEKVEQIDELQLDLQDVKEMYKAQIDELTKRSC